MNIRHTVVIIAAVALALTSAGAIAQPKGKGKGGPQVRYFDLSSSVFSELNAEVILKETRQGNTVVSAELDVCHLAAPDSNRLDRFVVPLKIEGVRLVGSAQSQEGKQAVTVNLARRALANGNVTFEGTIGTGSYSEKVRSTDNADMSEDEMAEQLPADIDIEVSPSDFSAAWPQAIFVRVGRGGLIGLLDAMRGENVRVGTNSLLTSCRVLRSGHHTVQIEVDPERVGAMLAKLKAVPAVAAAGFSASTPNMQRAVRFPSADFRDASGKLDRDKLAAAVAAAMAKAMAATVDSTSWDNTLGELKIELKRPDETVAGLKLTQLVTVTVIVAPESLSAHQRSILWIESIAARLVEERDGPRLQFVTPQGGEGEDEQSNEPDDSDDLPDAVASALKGETWDADKEQWQR
jgi:hypothetical protein